MRPTSWIALAVAILAVSGSDAQEEGRTLITSAVLPRKDCSSFELARDGGPEAYSGYAGCMLDRSFAVFAALYSRHLLQFPDEKQDVEIRFSVSATGNPDRVIASAPGVTDELYLRKIAARVRLIKLAPPADPAYEVVYTFRFASVER